MQLKVTNPRLLIYSNECIRDSKRITAIVAFGVPGSSVGRVADSGSRSPGFETRAGHLVVGSDST